MRNKKAWLRILEAFIAILLVAGVMFVLYVRQPDSIDKFEGIYRIQESILDEIANNKALREDILNDRKTIQIETFIQDRVPASFDFDYEICIPEEICELSEYKGVEGKDIYSTERLITSSLEVFSPKKLKIFMWEK